MNMLRTMRRIGGHQKNNLMNAFKGRPLDAPSLVAMTIDLDDAEIAEGWLRRENFWQESAMAAEYENEFARWNGSSHAYAFMGGRVALSAAIHALGLRAGDEVIVPGYTCIVVPNAFKYEKINVRYADIELDTYGPDVQSVKARINEKTKAILIHHLYGLVCRDYEALIDLAKDKGIKVIEDCAHATGAKYKGVNVGNRGDVAFYSSEQSKIFTTIQGGVASTNSDEIAEGLRSYREKAPLPSRERITALLKNVIGSYYQFKHPRRWYMRDVAELKYAKYRLISTTDEEMKGIRPSFYGERMPVSLAAVGLNQLRKIDQYNEKRREQASEWERVCDKKGWKKPVVVAGSKPVYLRYPVLVEPEKKKDLLWAARELGVSPGVWFVSNLHPVPGVLADCPNANLAVERCINFPSLLN